MPNGGNQPSDRFPAVPSNGVILGPGYLKVGLSAVMVGLIFLVGTGWAMIQSNSNLSHEIKLDFHEFRAVQQVHNEGMKEDINEIKGSVKEIKKELKDKGR